LTNGNYFITLRSLDRLPIVPAVIMRKQEATRLQQQNASQNSSKEIEMRDKRIKLIYFSLGGSRAKQISVDGKRILLLGSFAVLVLCLLAALILGGFTRVLHDYQKSRLTKANKQLKDQLVAIDEVVKNLDKKMKLLEEKEKDYCVFLEMPQINDDVRKVGTGGYARNMNQIQATSALDTDVRQEALAIHSILDQLTKRMNLSIQMRDEIERKFHEKEEDLKAFPSIWPVNGRRITDGFGPRIHPLTGKPDDHQGIDISAPRGTDVWATADGVVELAQNRYIPNKSYGKYVKINHGNDFCTLYGHLDKILVNEGQKITRGQVIGKVGTTGCSTAPHLHYEVIQDEKKTNPVYHMIDD
jgi:murein DD-endopeptidase MepM/ murein hydrolase activator NlpD